MSATSIKIKIWISGAKRRGLEYLGGYDATSHSTKGLGLLWILKAGGLVGKNTFEDFDVSPIMIFSQCHPLLRDNCFDNVFVDEDKQQLVEKRLLEQFRADLFRNDQYFYMVDSEANEKALQDVILKGPSECEEK